MLRRAPLFTVGNWASTHAGFTMRTGLGPDLPTSLRAIPLCRHALFLIAVSLPGWPAVLGGACALNLLPLGGNLTCAETAHHNFRVLRHLPCKEVQFLRVAFGNSLLEPMRVNHFSPRYKLCTEDDGEPILGGTTDISLHWSSISSTTRIRNKSSTSERL